MENNLKTHRKIKNISQKKLALSAGVSYGRLCKVERETRAFTIEQSEKVAKALNVSFFNVFPIQYARKNKLRQFIWPMKFTGMELKKENK